MKSLILCIIIGCVSLFSIPTVIEEVNNDMVNQIANELLMKKLLNFLHENNEVK